PGTPYRALGRRDPVAERPRSLPCVGSRRRHLCAVRAPARFSRREPARVLRSDADLLGRPPRAPRQASIFLIVESLGQLTRQTPSPRYNGATMFTLRSRPLAALIAIAAIVGGASAPRARADATYLADDLVRTMGNRIV